MVRKVELNCRNGWAADLWEPGSEGPGQAADSADAQLAAIADGRASPAERDGPPSPPLASGAAESAATLGEDVLVNQSPSPRSTATGDPAANQRDDQARPDNRELILRARDINRIRQANRTRPALAPIGVGGDDCPALSDDGLVEAGRPADLGGTQAAADVASATEAGYRASEPGAGRDETGTGEREALAARLAAFVPVPPVPATELRTDLLGLGANRADAASRFETVPTLDPTFALPFRERTEAAPLRAGFGLDDSLDEPVLSERDSSLGLDEPGQTPRRSGWAPSDQTSLVEQDGAPPLPPVNGGEDGHRWSHGRRPSRREAPALPASLDAAPHLPAPSTVDGRQMARSVLGEPNRDPEPRREGGRDLKVRPATGFEWSPDLDASPIVFDAEPSSSIVAELPLVDDPTHLPGVLRCCRTCRDFRPAEGGERGWCTNRWAFQHRRMVHGDEMPCWGAVGSWWVPHDDVWLDEWDVDHGHPTPHVDAMLARMAALESPPAASRVRRRGRN
jgi:hypothetical protein